MKRNVARLNLTVACLSLALAFSFTGCETLSKVIAATKVTASEQTSNALIVNAEKATFIAKDAMDTFLRLEYEHRAAYKAISPSIHDFAEKLRRDANGNHVQDGIDILVTARTATKALKANRTADNELNLKAALKTLQAVIADCQKYSALTLTKGQ